MNGFRSSVVVGFALTLTVIGCYRSTSPSAVPRRWVTSAPRQMLLLPEPLFSILRDLFEQAHIEHPLSPEAQVYLVAWQSWPANEEEVRLERAMILISRPDALWTFHVASRACSCDIPPRVKRWRLSSIRSQNPAIGFEDGNWIHGTRSFDSKPSPADARRMLADFDLEEIAFDVDSKTIMVQHFIDERVVDEILKFPQAEDLRASGHPMPEHAAPALWYNLTDEDISRIVDGMPELQIVSLDGQSRLTDACLDALARLPKIRGLTMTRTQISNAAAMKLKAAKPNLNFLWDFMRER